MNDAADIADLIVETHGTCGGRPRIAMYETKRLGRARFAWHAPANAGTASKV